MLPRVLREIGVLWSEMWNQRTAKGASGKGPRQKESKSVKIIFDTFRHFSRRAKKVKNRQTVSKIFLTLFDNFRAAPVFQPLLGGSDGKGVTGHVGTNTPKFVPPRWQRPPFDPTQTGLCKFGWVWSSLRTCHTMSPKQVKPCSVAHWQLLKSVDL